MDADVNIPQWVHDMVIYLENYLGRRKQHGAQASGLGAAASRRSRTATVPALRAPFCGPLAVAVWPIASDLPLARDLGTLYAEATLI